MDLWGSCSPLVKGSVSLGSFSAGMPIPVSAIFNVVFCFDAFADTVILPHPRVLQSLLNFALRLLRREPVTIEMNVRQMLVLFLGYLANSLVFGASFLLFVKALYPVGVDQFLYLTAALLITGFIGVLSVFAPGGLGVREGEYGYNLSTEQKHRVGHKLFPEFDGCS